MPDLTFGEQVKIILGRKGMTIKELAEVMEERTGKKMSRQNLTQRLGRDNFQERDMRMIASILGCPFKLSILEEDTLEKQEERTEDERESEKDKKTDKIEGTDETGEIDETRETDEPEEEHEEKMPETGREITVGEFLEIKETSGESEQENLLKELLAEMDSIEREGQERERERMERAQEREQAKEHQNAEKRGGWMSHFFRRRDEERISQAEDTEDATITDEMPSADSETQEREEEPGDAGAVLEPEETQIPEETETPEETEIPEEDEETESSDGEINPYTGKEYATNSVRMHPKRIGYVQVYSRKDHKWTDMTEWAFLGEQERKKVLLGKKYEPPVYLD